MSKLQEISQRSQILSRLSIHFIVSAKSVVIWLQKKTKEICLFDICRNTVTKDKYPFLTFSMLHLFYRVQTNQNYNIDSIFSVSSFICVRVFVNQSPLSSYSYYMWSVESCQMRCHLIFDSTVVAKGGQSSNNLWKPITLSDWMTAD